MSHAFHPAAEAEHLEQVAFYESRQPGLGLRYDAEVMSALARAGESPQLYAVQRPSGFHRVVLRHFPLTLYCRVSGGLVEVLAVAHHRRRPGYWRVRL